MINLGAYTYNKGKRAEKNTCGIKNKKYSRECLKIKQAISNGSAIFFIIDFIFLPHFHDKILLVIRTYQHIYHPVSLIRNENRPQQCLRIE